jgi:hypothetical protein
MAFKGLKEIQERSEEVEQLANQNRLKHVYLRDGESALIRFIGDDEMLQTKVHEYEEITPTGKRYRKSYCMENLTGAPCKWCASGNYAKNLYVFLAYTYHVIHKSQNPELNEDPNATKWTAVKQGSQVLYKEDVGEVRVLRIKWGKDYVNKNMILNFANTYGTLTDRDYVYSRTGATIHTSYSLVPKDKSEISDEVAAAIKEAPHIDEILGVSKEDKSEDSSPSGAKEPVEKDDSAEDLF